MTSDNSQQTESQSESDSDDVPYLVEIGADTREPADTINMSVESTVGPDFLGQETVDVDGHPKDRPGVQNRISENVDTDTDSRYRHSDVSQMDTGEELPVLLSSSMDRDPIEGTQGSYTQIVSGECNRCGYDRLKLTVCTLPGEEKRVCNACDAEQDRRGDGYTMRKTQKQRVSDRKNNGRHITSLFSSDVYETSESMGPYIDIIDSRSWTMLREDDVSELYFETIFVRHDIDDRVTGIAADITDELSKIERVGLAALIVPDWIELARSEDTDEESDTDE
jgi:hypothetical protein